MPYAVYSSLSSSGVTPLFPRLCTGRALDRPATIKYIDILSGEEASQPLRLGNSYKSNLSFRRGVFGATNPSSM